MKKEGLKFHTARGYELLGKDSSMLTPSMEDYLEMTYRFTLDKAYTRISDLAAALNVQPPSVTNMIKKMAEMELVHYEKYGVVILTDKGRELGLYLLERHAIIEDFLRLIGVEENVILEETEKIEHCISSETVDSIRLLLHLFDVKQELQKELKLMKRAALEG
ncbi:mn-dependent transcriptional regulator mntr [hydrocarbon metagenome]|uniref:Manganese transport regulator n=1 Tax=hydrocarbon metagenome TaxID=938273 RepID=A0A0W8E5R6_9ZZZZ